MLNLFVALQQCLSVATHWLADARLDVPAAYREALIALGDRGVIAPDLAMRLGAASGLRNLIAHRYGPLDWRRIHDIATNGVEDLVRFCDQTEQASRRA